MPDNKLISEFVGYWWHIVLLSHQNKTLSALMKKRTIEA